MSFTYYERNIHSYVSKTNLYSNADRPNNININLDFWVRFKELMHQDIGINHAETKYFKSLNVECMKLLHVFVKL